MKEFRSKELVESFGYQQIVPESGTLATGAKFTGKMAGKALPFVGTALSAEDALSRWQSGDKSGAVISTLAGLGYLIPGPAGWIVGAGLDALNMARDGTFSGEEDSAAIASSEKPESTAKLTALQKIIGAKPDGVFGPETKNKLMKWQASKGIKVDGVPGPETYTAAGLMENTQIMSQTLGEKIAAIRDKLASLEQESSLSEGSAQVAKAIWDAAKGGARSVDDIIAKLTKDGLEIPSNIQKWGQHAIDSTAKKFPSAPLVNQPSKMAPDLARLQGSKEALSGIKAQELAAREAAIARMSPNELAKAGLSSAEQQSIKRAGLIAWVKANPRKSAAVLAALGLGASMLGTTTSSGGMPSSAAPSKRGDPDIMKKQEMLNALTGSNLKIDGIWGPATQAAADKWYEVSAAQNADMKSQLDAIPKSPTATINKPVEPPIQPESDANKDATRNVPKAVSESDELTRIIQLLK